MARQILMELHIPGQQDGVFYIIDMPAYRDKGWYIQVTSFNWFRTRELNRAFPDATENTKRNGMNWMKYERTIKYTSEHHVHPNRTIQDYLSDIGVNYDTITYCDGVWDFYDKIGYDRKAKKYR